MNLCRTPIFTPDIALDVVAPANLPRVTRAPRVDHYGARWVSLFMLVCAVFTVDPASAQRDYTDLPVVKEGKTVKISPHVYVIPDENRRGVPNVGIVVGSRATLIIDPGWALKAARLYCARSPR